MASWFHIFFISSHVLGPIHCSSAGPSYRAMALQMAVHLSRDWFAVSCQIAPINRALMLLAIPTNTMFFQIRGGCRTKIGLSSFASLQMRSSTVLLAVNTRAVRTIDEELHKALNILLQGMEKIDTLGVRGCSAQCSFTSMSCLMPQISSP